MVNVFVLGDDHPFVAIRFDRETPPDSRFALVASFPNDQFQEADELASWLAGARLGEEAIFLSRQGCEPTAH